MTTRKIKKRTGDGLQAYTAYVDGPILRVNWRCSEHRSTCRTAEVVALSTLPMKMRKTHARELFIRRHYNCGCAHDAFCAD